jgi:alpha/beta superfamily hydrolase
MAEARTAGSCLFLTVLISALACNGAKSTMAQQSDTETAVCGAIREPLAFWTWRRTAGAPDPGRVAGVKGVERIQFKTRDARLLGGYRIAADSARGYLLIAQGNAMLADQLVADMEAFRNLGVDVYLYDYRGYGMSQGKSRLAAIVADYAEITAHLNTFGYSKRLLYGISMGGVILLDAVGNSPSYTRLVVDSSPGRISNLGCPERYDPITHLPEDSSRILIISGARDTVVPPSQMAGLIRAAHARGAKIMQDEEFAHPFQDAAEPIHRRRMNEIATFLLRD